MRQCPTRADGAVVLIAHTIAIPTCQDRQRALYHKCFTCIHRNERTLAETAYRPLPPRARASTPPPSNGASGGNGHVARGSADAARTDRPAGKPKRR